MLQDYLSSFNLLSSAEIAAAIQHCEARILREKDYFTRENNSCREIAFIVSGIFRSYYTAESGKDITYCFRFPGNFLASYTAFITGRPASENLQALSPSELLVFPKDLLDQLSASSHNWTRLLKTIAEQEYMELEQRFFQLQRDTAAQRYSNLMHHHPDYIMQIPLQHLASYLGITQRHLSRIRAQITF